MFLRRVLRKSYSSLRGDDRHWREEGEWNREKCLCPTFSSLVSLKLKEAGSHLNNIPTLIAALDREACSVFSMPCGEDSRTEVGEDVKWMESFSYFALVLGAAGSKRHNKEDHAILQCQLLQKEAKTRVLQVQVLAEL